MWGDRTGPTIRVNDTVVIGRLWNDSRQRGMRIRALALDRISVLPPVHPKGRTMRSSIPVPADREALTTNRRPPPA